MCCVATEAGTVEATWGGDESKSEPTSTTFMSAKAGAGAKNEALELAVVEVEADAQNDCDKRAVRM